MKKIRVVIIEDSRTLREVLTHLIGEDPRLEVVASFESAEEALSVLSRIAPDVISLDIRLPGMNGLEATLRIMAERPTPIVVVSANVDSDELNISMNALRAGALAVVEKPVGITHREYALSAKRICDQLVIMSAVKVVRQRFSRDLNFGPKNIPGFSSNPKLAKPATARIWQPRQFGILGVVASTGGPNALAALFQALPSDFPLPILLVQHITASFLESFASWLAGICPFKVVISREGEVPLPGQIYLAPVDCHVEIKAGRLKVGNGPPVSSQRPSGTVLFNSMAQECGSSAIGVLLTGMGDDGAQGLLAIQNAGGFTIAEDESTCVVFGMPAVAIKLGAACETLPLPLIAPRLVEILELESDIREVASGK